MLEKFKQSWRGLHLSKPGQRFLGRYEQQRKSAPGLWRRILFVGAGLLLVLVGIFFLPAPGPGLVIIFLGASLLARESLWIARALDETELALRHAHAWHRRWWRAASVALKVFVAVMVMTLAAAFVLGVYRWFAR